MDGVFQERRGKAYQTDGIVGVVLPIAYSGMDDGTRKKYGAVFFIQSMVFSVDVQSKFSLEAIDKQKTIQPDVFLHLVGNVLCLNDDYVIVKNGLLDIDRELVDDLMLEFPSKLLCKEECAGLCSKCGKSLNFGTCDCPKKKEIDSRFAILQKLLENDE